MQVIQTSPSPEMFRAFQAAQASVMLTKDAADAPVPTYSLSGRLVGTSSGWVLLEVPNSLVRGAFSALDEPGIELPPSGPMGALNAHISVMRPEEVEQIGGIDKITERGRRFYYQLGSVKTVQPAGWKEMSLVWFISIRSPELERLRKSYGLSSLPNQGKYEFHITVAVRRKGVLQNNEISKAAKAGEELLAAITKEARGFNPATSFSSAIAYSAADAGQTVMEQLEEARRESLRRNYRLKQDMMRKLLTQYPDQFTVRPRGKLLNIKHKPSNFNIQMAPSGLPSLYHRRKRTMDDVVNDAYLRLAAHAARRTGVEPSPDMQQALEV